MTTIAGSLVTAVLHRWHWRHPRFHALPLHTEGNGLGGTVTWAGR